MNFFSPKACSGSWTFIKCKVQAYSICILEAYSPRTDRRTDGRTDGVLNFLYRYMITTPSGSISYDYSCANFNVVAYVISMSTQLHQLQCVYCSSSQPVGCDSTWGRHRFSLGSPLVIRHFTKSMHNCTSIMCALVSVRNCALSPTRKTLRPPRGKISPTRGTICQTL